MAWPKPYENRQKPLFPKNLTVFRFSFVYKATLTALGLDYYQTGDGIWSGTQSHFPIGHSRDTQVIYIGLERYRIGPKRTENDWKGERGGTQWLNAWRQGYVATRTRIYRIPIGDNAITPCTVTPYGVNDHARSVLSKGGGVSRKP